jgi:hypothetical protein
MVISLIIGILILVVVVYVAIRIAKDVVIGIALIGLILLATFLIVGSIPDLKTVPIIGPALPKFPTSLTDIVSTIKRILYDIKIMDVSKDSENRVLITIKNTGRLKASNFSVYIDDKKANIINKPKDPLSSGEITTIQTDWKDNFNKILVQSSKVNATYTV